LFLVVIMFKFVGVLHQWRDWQEDRLRNVSSGMGCKTLLDFLRATAYML